MSRTTFLTSTAIEKNDDGNYPWNYTEWLVIHENLRREFLRGEAGIVHMENLLKHPWKVNNFHTWLTEFLWPAVHVHHDSEESVIGPHYAAKGETVSWGNEQYAHEALLAQMHVVEKSSTELYSLVKLGGFMSCDGFSEEQKEAIKAKYDELKLEFAKVKEFFWIHLKLEEEIWSQIYLKYGEKDANIVVNAILKHGLAQKGDKVVAFNAVVGAVLDAMHYQGTFKGSYPPTLPNALDMAPWCSEKFVTEFLKKIPHVPRKFIFPARHKAYVSKWKRMIESVCGNDDVMYLTKPPASCCTIS